MSGVDDVDAGPEVDIDVTEPEELVDKDELDEDDEMELTGDDLA